MNSLLKTGNTYDTVGGYQVTLLDKEYVSHDLIVYKGIVHVGENQYYAYFNDTGDCIIFDNVIMRLIGNIAIELFDIVLSDKEITEAYDVLPNIEVDESILSIIEEALNEFKTELTNEGENSKNSECDGCKCSSDEDFILDIIKTTITKLKQSVDLLHKKTTSCPHDKDLWNSYSMMLNQLNSWVSYLK